MKKTPVRYQRKRTPGWKKPHKDVVNVARPSMFGNPFYVEKSNIGKKKWSVFFKDKKQRNPMLVKTYETRIEAQTVAVALFDRWFDDTIAASGSDLFAFRNKYSWHGFTLATSAKFFLHGKDIMCWCDLKDPCHGDVILRKCN